MPSSRPRSLLARPLLVAVLVLATALGSSLAPTSASAATGPTAVDDVIEVEVTAREGFAPGATDDLPGSAPLRSASTDFPRDQLAWLPAGSWMTDRGTYLVYAGFGTFFVSDEDGRLGFAPKGVTGRRTVHYRITDTAGRSAVGRLTVTVVAGGRWDVVHTVQDTPVIADLLANDSPGSNADGTPGFLDRTSVRFAAAQDPSVKVSDDSRVARIEGVGAFTLDATTGLLTYVPDPEYFTPYSEISLDYTARDTTRTRSGDVAHHVYTTYFSWTVSPDGRLRVSEQANPQLFAHVGDELTFTSTITNGTRTALARLALSHSLGRRLTPDDCAPVALGETLPAGASTTCTATTRARQQDLDAKEAWVDDTVVTSATTESGQPVVARAPEAARATADIMQGLVVTAASNPASVATPGQRVDLSFVVWNRGNRSVRDLIVSTSSPGVSALVCAPVPLGGPLGDGASTTCRATRTVTAADLMRPVLTATVKATAAPVYGVQARAVNAGVTLRTPVTQVDDTPPVVLPPSSAGPVSLDDSASTTVGQPVVLDVLANDRPGSPDVPLVATSVRLRTRPGLPKGSVLYGDAKTLKVPGRGVFLVSGTGQVTYVPLGWRTGPVPTIGYQVSDANGSWDRSTLDVVVR